MRSRISRFLAVTIVVLLPFSALAGDEVGKMNGNAAGVEWALSISGHDAILMSVVAPDGTTYQKTFRGGQTPRFGTGDLKKAGSVDGTYTYELRVVPQIPGHVKAALAQARAAGDEAGVSSIMKANGLESSVVQSGSFGVVNGAFLDPNAKENDANDAAREELGSAASSATNSGVRRPGAVTSDDQVIPDDLIVQGSICAGFDCVNNESFGFDTIRMKENNTQLAYDDTSTSAGFPNNDWNIQANDTNSGGAGYLAFTDVTAGRKPFTVRSGAPANALYVAADGNIGMQTSTPSLDFHMVESDTPAIRLEQTSAGGFTAQTWDIGANEANFFVRDLTGGSKLSFRIRPGAPTSSIDIAASGNVGIGTASPAENLHVYSSGTSAGVRVDADSTGGRAYSLQSTGAGNAIGAGYFGVYDQDASAFRMAINSSGNMGVGTTNPSQKLEVNGGVNTTSSGGYWQGNWKTMDYSGNTVRLGGINAGQWDSVDFYTSGSQRARITSDGRFQFANGVQVLSGAGSPEGVVTSPVGSLYLRTDGGATTTLYVKTSGAGNTGWTAK